MDKSRELIFRGWCDRSFMGETVGWHYGSFATCESGDFIIPDFAYMSYGYELNCHVGVDIKTVGQFIGIRDRNFNLIFEGDIISNEKAHRLIVFWNSVCSCFMAGDSNSNVGMTFGRGIPVVSKLKKENNTVYACTDSWTIVGNIHNKYDSPKEH